VFETLKTSPLTYGLIIVNSVAYLFIALLSFDFVDLDLEILARFGGLYGSFVLVYDEWWRLLSAMFLHADMTHILMNLFSLYIVGSAIEEYFDHKSYLLIYFGSGLIAAETSLYMHPMSLTVGASGAIFGLFGALGGFFVANRHKIGTQIRQLMQSFGLILFVNLVLGLMIPSIDMSAHIAGLVVGIISGFLLVKYQKSFVYLLGGVIVILYFGAMWLRAVYL